MFSDPQDMSFLEDYSGITGSCCGNGSCTDDENSPTDCCSKTVEEVDNSLVNGDSSRLKSIINNVFGTKFDSSKKYVISIQGSSTTGKTTLANMLVDLLTAKCPEECKPVKISTDWFYKSQTIKEITADCSQASSCKSENNGKSKILSRIIVGIENNGIDETTGKPISIDVDDYDYDNPAALNWDLLKNAVKSLIYGEDTYTYYEYSYKTKQNQEKKVKNEGYNIIIVEGIYGHNLFNDKVFDIKQYNPMKPNKYVTGESKEFHRPVIENNFEIDKSKYSVFKILMNLDRDTMLSNRIKVDKNRKGDSWEEDETRNRFDKFIWPATERWINWSAISNPEVILDNGSWDYKKILDVLNSFTNYFGDSKVTEDDIKNYFEGILRIE